MSDTSINATAKHLVHARQFCAAFHDDTAGGVIAKRVQYDEIWSITAGKQQNVSNMQHAVDGAGYTWTGRGIYTYSKLIACWLLGGRNGEYSAAFMDYTRNRLAARDRRP